MNVSIRKAAQEMGAALETLRRWAAAGKIEVEQTPRGIPRYDLARFSGPLKNHTLARAIPAVGLGEVRQQLEYKTAWCGSRILIADRFFPSSKMCSGRPNVKEELD